MRFIRLCEKGPVYDTDNMEYIADIQKRFLINGFYSSFWCKMYATRENPPQYILVRRINYDVYKPELIKESEAKALLAHFRYDIFLKRFENKEKNK